MTHPRSKPLLHEILAAYWPVVIFLSSLLISILVFGIQADAAIKDLKLKTDKYDILVLDRTDRLAKLETGQLGLSRQVDKIDSKLDTILGKLN